MHNTSDTTQIHEKVSRRAPKNLFSLLCDRHCSAEWHSTHGLGMKSVRSIQSVHNHRWYPSVLYRTFFGDTQRFPGPTGLTECGAPAAPSLTMRDFLWGKWEEDGVISILTAPRVQDCPNPRPQEHTRGFGTVVPTKRNRPFYPSLPYST